MDYGRQVWCVVSGEFVTPYCPGDAKEAQAFVYDVDGQEEDEASCVALGVEEVAETIE